MNVTFRPCTPKDVEQLAAIGVDLGSLGQRRFRGEARGSVVTIDGCVVLVTDREGHVAYQIGGEAIADLIRAQRRVWDALNKLDHDVRNWIERKGRVEASINEILDGRAEQVGRARRYVRK